MKSPIALLTDFGTCDHYAGSMRGVILGINPDAAITDITHEIGPQNIAHASFILNLTYECFPRGTVFICVVDPGVGTSRRILCVKTRDYFFLAPDNGLLSLALKSQSNISVRSITNSRYFFKSKPSATFHGRDIFSAVGAHLSKNPSIFSKLGPRISSMKPLDLPKTKRLRDAVHGQILFFDYFGNAITNIRKSELVNSRMESAKARIKKHSWMKLQKTYGEKRSSMIALWNSSDFLEIAVPGGHAERFAGLKIGQPVQLSFAPRFSRKRN